MRFEMYIRIENDFDRSLSHVSFGVVCFTGIRSILLKC